MSDDYDPDGHVYDLEDVCTRLDSIEAAVTANHPGIWIGWGLAVGFAIFVWISQMWFSKTRISWWYGVSTDQVTIEKKPPDCDFFHAPLGDKSCHYDSQMSTVQVGVGTNLWGGQSISYDEGNTWIRTARNANGDPIVSNDDGKSWSLNSVPPFTKPQVIVSWEKKDDD
jgi:hypothetical protein